MVSAIATIRIGTATDYVDYDVAAGGAIVVQEPTLNQLISTTTSATPAVGIRNYGWNGTDQFLEFGTLESPGINVTGKLTAPAAGSAAFIQLITSAETSEHYITGYAYPGGTYTTNGYVLDDGNGTVFYSPAMGVAAGVVQFGPPHADSPASERVWKASPGASRLRRWNGSPTPTT